MSRTSLTDIPREAARILAKRRRDLKKLADNPDYSDAYKARKRAEIDQAAQSALADLQESRHKGAQSARRMLDQELSGPTPSTDKAQLQELRAERIWKRYERRLERGENYLHIVRDARDSGDPAALAVLRDELPDYLRAQSRDRHLGATNAKAALSLIDQAQGDSLPDDKKALRAQQGELDKMVSRIDLSLGHVDYELSKGVEATILVDADGSTFDPATVD